MVDMIRAEIEPTASVCLFVPAQICTRWTLGAASIAQTMTEHNATQNNATHQYAAMKAHRHAADLHL